MDEPPSQVCGAAIRQAELKSPYRMKMGMSFISDLPEWLIVDADRKAEVFYKRKLYKSHAAQVWVTSSPSREAQREVYDAISRFVRVYASDDVSAPPANPDHPALLRASWLVQDDLCIMQRDGAGAWRLTAASVCFPSRWDLPSKLGATLSEIHAPVPGYEARLARSADRFFDALQPNRIAVRGNWSLTDTADRFQPAASSRDVPPISELDAPDRVHFRFERQTLRRLPKSDAILFTIRTFRDHLRTFRASPQAASELAKELRSMPDALADYKAIPAIRPAVLAWLDRVAAESRRPFDVATSQ